MTEKYVDSATLPVYIHFTFGHGVKVAVTLTDIYDAYNGVVSPKLFTIIQAKLNWHHATLTK
jgi:hypothetical protein